ncbi:hypothetical protein ACJIZ3_005691 [Penstemon smallii]|uniref:Uncharacterized protein n=1 Tax=Penstemon smallii TaxID=265156 RepID=A0ABD3S5K8_9LAMI
MRLFCAFIIMLILVSLSRKRNHDNGNMRLFCAFIIMLILVIC